MDGGQGHPDILSNGTVQERAVAQQSDPGARHQLLRRAAAADEALQPSSVGWSQLQVNAHCETSMPRSLPASFVERNCPFRAGH